MGSSSNFKGSDPILSVDLDSTLADTRHRKGIIEQYTSRGLPVDWEAYAKACAQDALTPFGETLKVIQPYIPWVVVSGRSEGARDATEAWLAEHGLFPEEVYLEGGASEAHSRLGHAAWKAQRIMEVVSFHPSIRAHVDDWPQISQYLEEHGIYGVTVVPPGMVPVFPEAKAQADNPL